MSTVEQSILQMVMIPQVRDIALGHLQEWMFTSELCQNIHKAMNEPGTSRHSIPDPREFIMRLSSSHNVSDDDCTLAYQLIVDVQDRRDYDLEAYVSHITEFVRDRTLGRGVELIASGGSGRDKMRGQEYLQHALNFSISTDQFYDFSDLTKIQAAKDADLPPGGSIIKSHYGLINKCSLYGGFKFGDLICYSGRPGGGKSTSMVDEGAFAIMQGFKVCHIFLGDMSEYDAFIKYLSYFTGATTNDIIANGYENYITPEIAAYFKRLRVKALPADQYNVYQVLAKANQLRAEFEFELLCIDYDANIKASGGEGMYGEGGNTYANLKSYGHNKCVVMVGSQIKNEFWDHEIVPLNALAESSKKQHHLDMLINIGRNKICPSIGTLNIAKMRRGISEIQSRLHLDYAMTRIKEISQDAYNLRLAEHKVAAAAAASMEVTEEGTSIAA